MSASSDLAKKEYGDGLYYVKHQLGFGFATGFLGFLIGYFLYYRNWEKLAPWIFLACIVLLFLVFSPLGLEVKGSERWIDLRLFSFQPSELLKFGFVLFLAAWFSKNIKRARSFTQGFLPFLLLLGVVAVLLFVQPSTSIAVIICLAALIMYFVAGSPKRYVALIILLAVLAFTALVYITPYRMERIQSFLQPGSDPLGKDYQKIQAELAIGSGGLEGVGFGKSTTKLKNLPEPIGDSIFAVIGEELGFIGTMSLVIVFLLFILRGFVIAKHAPENFGRLFAVGFSSIIGIQAFINIGAISGLIPLTGVPLPFISFGGTALTIFLTMSGIVANISRYQR